MLWVLQRGQALRGVRFRNIWFACSAFEQELLEVYQIGIAESGTYCGRADGPRFVWKPILPPTSRDRPQSKPIVRTLRWLIRMLDVIVVASDHLDAVVFGGIPVKPGVYSDAVLAVSKLRAGLFQIHAEEGWEVWGSLASSIVSVFPFSFTAAAKMAKAAASGARAAACKLEKEVMKERSSGFSEWIVSSLAGGRGGYISMSKEAMSGAPRPLSRLPP